MRHQEQDPFGSTDLTTEYEREGKPGGKSGSSRTKMAVGLTAVTLTLFLSWLLITPFDSDPRSGGGGSDHPFRSKGAVSETCLHVRPQAYPRLKPDRPQRCVHQTID